MLDICMNKSWKDLCLGPMWTVRLMWCFVSLEQDIIGHDRALTAAIVCTRKLCCYKESTGCSMFLPTPNDSIVIYIHSIKQCEYETINK